MVPAGTTCRTQAGAVGRGEDGTGADAGHADLTDRGAGPGRGAGDTGEVADRRGEGEDGPGGTAVGGRHERGSGGRRRGGQGGPDGPAPLGGGAGDGPQRLDGCREGGRGQGALPGSEGRRGSGGGTGRPRTRGPAARGWHRGPRRPPPRPASDAWKGWGIACRALLLPLPPARWTPATWTRALRLSEIVPRTVGGSGDDGRPRPTPSTVTTVVATLLPVRCPGPSRRSGRVRERRRRGGDRDGAGRRLPGGTGGRPGAGVRHRRVLRRPLPRGPAGFGDGAVGPLADGPDGGGPHHHAVGGLQLRDGRTDPRRVADQPGADGDRPARSTPSWGWWWRWWPHW